MKAATAVQFVPDLDMNMIIGPWATNGHWLLPLDLLPEGARRRLARMVKETPPLLTEERVAETAARTTRGELAPILRQPYDPEIRTLQGGPASIYAGSLGKVALAFRYASYLERHGFTFAMGPRPEADSPSPVAIMLNGKPVGALCTVRT